MELQPRFLSVYLVLCLIYAAFPLIAAEAPNKKLTSKDFYQQMGHAVHRGAFNAAPRERPQVMDGIGKSHFSITTSHPEVQMWFDQGNTLLHLFWFYEAERAFRWCLQLDPDCAMAYWGLARSRRDMAASFIEEASRLKDKVTERERLYIEAWEALYTPDPLPGEGDSTSLADETREKFQHLLEKIVVTYPDDIEAKLLFVLETLSSSSRYGNEMILQEVLARAPEHPAAHLYRIHNWDGWDGGYALESCTSLSRIAPNASHAQHMPGRTYSGLGIWHEAAIAMDAAIRVEKHYMRQQLSFPFNHWSYAHTQNYLSYIQEQLGMAEAAISGAQQLLAVSFDPQYNRPDQDSTHWQGMIALMRTLIKFERWEQILDPETFAWRDSVRDKMYKAYCETVAYIGMGNLEKATEGLAAHIYLKWEIETPENRSLEKTYTVQSLEMHGLLALSKGDTLNGLALLTNAAERELKILKASNGPPDCAVGPYNTLGRAYLAQKSPALAVKAFEKRLEVVRNDGFALSGLVEAYAAMEETEKAENAYARLLYVWSDADANLKWLRNAEAIGLSATPKDNSPVPQRNYRKTSLDHFGPNVWGPYEAPQLDALDVTGHHVTLDEYRGKNVLLIFYVGEQCTHCIDQLAETRKRKSDFNRLNTEILAISGDTPEDNAASLMMKLPFRLLSDVNFENSRRFKSYDDFEELDLHATILIDKQGRVHWGQNGTDDPFMNFDFLLEEIQRMNQSAGE